MEFWLMIIYIFVKQKPNYKLNNKLIIIIFWINKKMTDNDS